MGFLDSFGDGASIISGRTTSHRRPRHKKRRSRSRSRSRSSSRRRSGRSVAGSVFGGDRHHERHNSSRSSFFGLGGGNNSRSSFFGTNRSSYYKRSPRQGFIQKSIKHVKRVFRDLVHWAKRHPWKVFFVVILPLITGGFLTALLARFGLRIPPAIQRMLNTASKAASGGSTAGIVGSAVKMASGGLNNGAGTTKVRIDHEEHSLAYGSDSGNWGSGLASMAKKFM